MNPTPSTHPQTPASTAAKQLAARCNIELWDQHVLEEKIKRVW